MRRSATAGINPYCGLRSFDEADAARFHGRSQAIDDLVELVSTSRFVTVIGSSGSGKSSVVRAGLVPELRSLGHAVVLMVPGDDPLGTLIEALRDVTTLADADTSADVHAAAAAVADRFGRLTIVVDQFEECWTRAGDRSREAFVAAVEQMIDDDSISVGFVATVRADLSEGPLEHPTLGHRMTSGAYVLAALSPTELEAVIVAPAAGVGVGFEEVVVADLIAEAIMQPGSLPLLQFTLTELYDRRVDATIGRAALDSIGGMAGAIGRRAEEVFAGLDDPSRSDARHLFARLVAVGDGAPDARRRARRSELSPAMQAVADRFVEARLLTTDRDPVTREPTVEVAHEALLARWGRLAGWVDEDRRWLAQLQHLSDSARSWAADGRSENELYRGARLEAAIDAIEIDGRAVSNVEREFIEAGRAARDTEIVNARRTAKRLRRRLTAVAAALVVAVVAAAVAVVQRSDARDAQRDALDAAGTAQAAEARALRASDEARAAEADALDAAGAARAAEANALDAANSSAASERAAQIEALVGRAESLRRAQRDVAALLAVEAFRLADTPRTRSALFGTFTNDEGFLDAHRFPGERGTSGIVLPDGATAFLTAQDGRVHPYDLDDGTLGDPLPAIGADDRFPVLAASPDSTRLAVASRADPRLGPTTFGVVDVGTGDLVAEPVVLEDPVTAIAFVPDGRVALATGENGHVVLLDAATGIRVGEVPGVDIEADNTIWTSELGLRRPSSVEVAGNHLVVGAADGTLRVVDADTLALRRTIALGPETMSNLRPLVDGTVITSGRRGAARVDLATGATRWVDSGFERCTELNVLEQRGLLYCGDPYGRLEERDLTDGDVLRSLEAQNGSTESLWITGNDLVAFGRNEPVVSRWRLDRSGPITTLVASGWTPYAFDHDGRRLLLESDGFESAIVDLTAGSPVTPLGGLFAGSWADEESVIGFAVSPDGDFVYTSIDVATGERTFSGSLVDPNAAFRDIGQDVAVDVFPAANELDTGKERMLLRYRSDRDNWLSSIDVATGQFGPVIPVDGLVAQAINRSGDRIAAGTPRGVEIFDGDTGALLDEIPVEDLRQVFITVTDQLFVGSLGGELTQYDLDTLEPIRSFGGSRGQVFHLHGTRDGSLIALSGSDRLVSVFDVATGVQIGSSIPIAADERNRVTLSIDGRWLAVGGQPNHNEGVQPGTVPYDKAAQIWDLDPASWTAAACDVAGRNLTRSEWVAHIGELAPYRQTCPEFPTT
jgi:WD40 repeat protein